MSKALPFHLPASTGVSMYITYLLDIPSSHLLRFIGNIVNKFYNE